MSSRLYSADSFRGEVVLQGQLDYERSNIHVMKVCALVSIPTLNPGKCLQVDFKSQESLYRRLKLDLLGLKMPVKYYG